MRASLGFGARGFKVSGAVAADLAGAADGEALGAVQPAAIHSPNTTATAMAAKYFVFMQLIKFGTASTQYSVIRSERNLFTRAGGFD
jgi:hypothetical protein